MPERGKIENLEDLLDRLEALTGDGKDVSLQQVFDAIGHRSFGPWLLVAGLVTLSPIGGIPGVPTLMGVIVLLVAVQLLFRRRYFWLPGWLLRRSASSKNFRKTTHFARKPARFIDRLLSVRLVFFTGGLGAYVIALLCVVIALGLPPMEFVPFSATSAGTALTVFGLALIMHDGLLALLGVAFTIATYTFLINQII
ncbi:MAG: exopolysaccharide biosynthesis protein [Proteobacteria bacterium]|nr:exopolysaccharide biosynthesis protein [Pseudomonadota bacterium]